MGLGFLAEKTGPPISKYSSVWLERRFWEPEAEGPNPSTLTKT
jgi:hypothetical protein